jgi:hypothetical protein
VPAWPSRSASNVWSRTLDIDLDDYRDQFLQSLAEDYAYQDE